jgi:hypothetical protein
MQQRGSLKQEAAAAGAAAVQFRKPPVHELWIRAEPLGQPCTIETQHVQHAWRIVLRLPTCNEQEFDAGAQALR